MKITWNKLFGLKDPSLDNLLWNVFWMMRGLTINVDSRSDFKAGVLQYIFSTMCISAYMYYYQVGMIYSIGWVYPETRDILVMSIIVSLAFASQISTVKIVGVIIFRNRIKGLIDKYRAFDTTLQPGTRYTSAVLRALKTVKRRALIFWNTFCSTSAIYLFLPAFLPGHNLPENGLEAYGFRPMTESPNYEITYTFNGLAGIFATAGIANVTVLLIVLSGYIEAHLLALVDELDCLWPDAERNAEECRENDNENRRRKEKYIHTNKSVKRILADNIKKHITLLEFHKTVKELFNEMLALEFLLTTIAMCAMLLGGLEDTYLQIPYTIAQLVVDTILGQRLIDASDAFQEAVARCGWENFDPSNMKTVQILLLCSQKTLTLTAGNVTYLSYICFTTIVRFVYSAYATLRQAMD